MIDRLIEATLGEDLGLAGDITTAAVVPADALGSARISARASGRIAGIDVARAVFMKLSTDIAFDALHSDGTDVDAGTAVAELRGSARAILTGERTALNILTRLSGIATATRDAVTAVAPYPTKVACTRKTTPGLRSLEKYAVRVGGASNHRFGLFDGVLIKDNHIAVAGSIGVAVTRARSAYGHMVRIEVEVDTLDQLREAMAAQADAVLLDNMMPDMVREAVEIADGRVITEASGGLRPDNIHQYAAAGVDVVSLGWLTHSVTGLDLGLDWG